MTMSVAKTCFKRRPQEGWKPREHFCFDNENRIKLVVLVET
jgi:hypothetical protein